MQEEWDDERMRGVNGFFGMARNVISLCAQIPHRLRVHFLARMGISLERASASQKMGENESARHVGKQA